MCQSFMKWLQEHKGEYGVKIIENPTEEQKQYFEKDCQDFKDWIDELKVNASK